MRYQRCQIASPHLSPVRHRVLGMSAVTTSLETALALVMAADAELVSKPGLGSAALSLRCYEVQALLRECAELGPAEPTDGSGSVLEYLHRAAEVLDAIPVQERPARLGPARAELAGALQDAQDLVN